MRSGLVALVDPALDEHFACADDGQGLSCAYVPRATELSCFHASSCRLSAPIKEGLLSGASSTACCRFRSSSGLPAQLGLLAHQGLALLGLQLVGVVLKLGPPTPPAPLAVCSMLHLLRSRVSDFFSRF